MYMVISILFPLLTLHITIPQTVDAGNFSNPNFQIDRNEAGSPRGSAVCRISIDLKIWISKVACVRARGLTV